MRAVVDKAQGPGRMSLVAWLLVVSLGHLAIAAVGARGWSDPVPWMIVLGVAGLAGNLAMVWIVWRVGSRRGRQEQLVASGNVRQMTQELESARSRLRACETRLREVIDAVPAGVAIYDNQDRLLIFNQEVSRQYPYSTGDDVIGQTYEALMRRALAQGRDRRGGRAGGGVAGIAHGRARRRCTRRCCAIPTMASGCISTRSAHRRAIW